MVQWWRKGGGEAVHRITGARQSLRDDVRGRQRRYVISMLIRTASVILTVLLWNVSRPIAVVTLVLGAVLPYIAVVVANAGREKAPSNPSSFVTGAERLALPPRDLGESGYSDHSGDSKVPPDGRN